MKKYTIKDNLGNKKTIYAEDVAHAMQFADETYNPEYLIQQFKSYVSNIIKDLYGNQYNVDTVRAISKLDSYVSQVIDDFKADIKNSNLDKRKTVQYYMQYVNALYRELTDVKNVKNINGQSLKKIDDIYEKMARSIHDSKLEDVSLTNGDWFTLRNEKDATIYKIVSVSHDSYVTDVYRVEVDFDAKKSFIRKVGSKSFHTSNIKGRDDITTLAVKFNSAEEAMNWLKRQNRLTSNLFKQHDSKLEDAVSLIKGDWFTLRKHNDVVYKVVDDQRKPINGFSGSMIVETYRITFTNDYEDYTIKKIGNESFRPDKWSSPDIVKFNSAEEAINWLRRQLRLKKHEFDSKLEDEASLATTINALVNDEKAAIDAYDVAIKNLEGKINEAEKQVLINIRDDERRHIENLYAILNGQVTEKNLEDSKTANEAER